MRKLINIIANYISKNNNYTKEQTEIMEYSMTVLLYEILKIISELVIYSLLGFSLQAIIILIVMSTTKPFFGGFHEDTQIKCFSATLILIGSIIYLSQNIIFDLISKVILAFILLFCIWQQIPIINPKMNLTKPELINKNRRIGIVFAIIYFVFAIAFYKIEIISNTIMWVMLFQTLLLFNNN